MTKKQAKWIDEFDEKFSQMDLSTESIFRGNIYRAKDFLKDFISAQIRRAEQQSYEKGFIDGGDASKNQESEIIICQLKEAEQRERKRVSKMIEGMKKTKIKPDWDDSNWAINDGYNTAIQDLLEKLNESK